MRKKTVQTSSTKSSTKGNAKSNTKSNARNSVKSSVKSSAKNSPQKAVKTVAPTVENVSVKQAVIIQEPSVEQNIPTRQPDLGPRRSVAFIGSECYPFVKTGGLGDVMSALPKSLAKLNIDVKVIIPRYKCIPQKFQEKMEYRGSFDMNLCSDGKQYYVGIMEYQEDGVVYDFIDNDEFFSWGNPYTNLIDDIPKFCYFAKAALAALNYLNWTPDVVHCHDWQAALVPLYLRTCFQDTDVGRAISVLTIHNLKFQGIYDRKKIQYWSGLPDYVFNKDCMIQNWLDANMLKGGIAYSNKVTTVSNTYAWEIQTEEYGEGLAEHLRYHNNKILGIVNGIDTDIWNPATDKLLAADYDEKSAIKNKKINKKALQESLGLDVDEHKMVIGLISRLTNQKGLDLVNDVIPGIMDEHTQVVVLGTGDSQYENTFRYYENKYKGNFCAYIAYNENVAHNIYAGCDALAKAIAAGEAPANACPVGGAPVAAKIGAIMGEEVGESVRMTAFVKCAGDCDKAKENYVYSGAMDCTAMNVVPNGGSKACTYGCMGYGSCVKACPFDAIHIVNGIAVVDKGKCKACGKCVAVCPRHLIEIIPYKSNYTVNCSSNDKGKDVMSACSVGCIGCMLCTKQCEFGAITVENNIAHIDYSKCTGCGKCAEKCPKKIIHLH